MERRFDVDKIGLAIADIDFWGKSKLNNGGLRIYWESTIGFGSLDIVKTANGQLGVYTEYMDDNSDKAFTKKLLELLLEKLEVVE